MLNRKLLRSPRVTLLPPNRVQEVRVAVHLYPQVVVAVAVQHLQVVLLRMKLVMQPFLVQVPI